MLFDLDANDRSQNWFKRTATSHFARTTTRLIFCATWNKGFFYEEMERHHESKTTIRFNNTNTMFDFKKGLCL